MVNGNPECNYFDMNYEKHKKENDIPLLNYRKRNTSSIVADTLINQYTNTIKMGTSDFIAGNIMYRNKLVKPVMGMDFISHFDWIIDIQKEKVYVKQIKEIPPVSNLYQVSIMDDTLRISSLPVDDTKYRLFSVIEYINGEKITMDNICRMEKLLNKENGFKENEITISPSSSLRIRSKE